MKKLSITSLTLEAIGVFKERTTIALDTQKDRPVILVEGMNGCGKTTFLQMLQVVLYGARVFGQKKGAYNEYIRDLIRLDTISEPSVSIQLLLINGKESTKFAITRSWSNQGKTLAESFVAYQNDKLWTQDHQHWADLIDDFLPVALAELFFFDGEKIEEMANPDKLPEILKKATEVLLGVGEIDSILTDLLAYDRRCLTKLKTESKDDQNDANLLKNKTNELNLHNQSLSDLIQTRASLVNQLDQAQKSLDNFRASSDQQGLTAYERAIQLRTKLKDLESHLADLYRDRVKLVSHPHFPFVQHHTVLKAIIESYKKESLAINGRQSSAALLEFNRNVRQRLLEQFPNFVSSIDAILSAEKDKLLNAMKVGSAFRPMNIARIEDSVTELKKEYLKLVDKITQCTNESLSIQALIDAAPSQEKIELILKNLSKHEADVEKVKRSLLVIDTSIESTRNLISRVEAQINHLEVTMKKTLQTTERIRFTLEASKRSQKVLLAYKQKLLANKADWLSSAICNHFQKLLRKRNFIQSIRIDPCTYGVTLFASSGKEIPLSRLSAGERQMLATAVLRAIMSAKSSEIPVVVDTPLARLDGAHRMNLVRNFYTKVSHQVMILSTDEEISGKLKEEIERSVAHSYQFIYNENEQATNVSEN